ncbi:unnamed protein product, partial [Prunus brigantina]
MGSRRRAMTEQMGMHGVLASVSLAHGRKEERRKRANGQRLPKSRRRKEEKFVREMQRKRSRKVRLNSEFYF